MDTMIANFLNGNDGTVLVVGLTPDDLEAMALGRDAPIIEVGKLVDELDCGPVVAVKILLGETEESIAATISEALGRGPDMARTADDTSGFHQVLGGHPSPANMAAEAAEARAIRRAKARLN